MASQTLKCLLIFLVTSEFLILDIVGQLDNVPRFSQVSQSGDNSDNGAKELQVNYQLHQPHHIVKRKSKMGRGFSFGKSKGSKSKPKNQNRDPYPKQPAYNPNYHPSAPAGAPPAYPGTNSRPGYPAGAPPPYPGTGGHAPSYPAGPPPAYPGTGGAHHNMPAYPPAYPGYSQPNYGHGSGGYGQGFGGKGFNPGYSGPRKQGGLSKVLGSPGFGAVAGAAVGAYGGYKLGKMVGGLGRNGYYGYYGDDGKYIRCDPPKNIKFDPETNITYIPLTEAYDQRCSYFNQRPPSYFGGYTNGAGNSMLHSHPINKLMNSIVDFTIFSSSHLMWDNLLAFATLGAVLIF